jgi:hypothetical protein
MHEAWKGGASWLCFFGISLQIPTEVTPPNITGTTFNEPMLLGDQITISFYTASFVVWKLNRFQNE